MVVLNHSATHLRQWARAGYRHQWNQTHPAWSSSTKTTLPKPPHLLSTRQDKPQHPQPHHQRCSSCWQGLFPLWWRVLQGGKPGPSPSCPSSSQSTIVGLHVQKCAVSKHRKPHTGRFYSPSLGPIQRPGLQKWCCCGNLAFKPQDPVSQVWWRTRGREDHWVIWRIWKFCAKVPASKSIPQGNQESCPINYYNTNSWSGL